jgi:endonuclease/exonuclease/phosphatase family metal-dependent hydrolase
VKVATWNLDSWKAPRREPAYRHDEAWRYLTDEIRADIALLQECVPPAEFQHGVVWPGPIGGHRQWGSAVFAPNRAMSVATQADPIWRGRRLGQANLLVTLPGCVAVARTQLASGAGLTCISVYGVIESGYASTTMHRILSDLEPLFDDPELGDAVLIGGDLNTCTQWRGDDEKFNARDASVLERLASFGLMDCLDALRDRVTDEPDCPCLGDKPCRHVRTQRNAQHPEIPYQNDYLFASKHLVRDCLVDVEVHNASNDRAWDFSDHCPVIATFDLD